eukprot:scaffold229557_cov26-Tisochrysis_lutea.AAC.1
MHAPVMQRRKVDVVSAIKTEGVRLEPIARAFIPVTSLLQRAVVALESYGYLIYRKSPAWHDVCAAVRKDVIDHRTHLVQDVPTGRTWRGGLSRGGERRCERAHAFQSIGRGGVDPPRALPSAPTRPSGRRGTVARG